MPLKTVLLMGLAFLLTGVLCHAQNFASGHQHPNAPVVIDGTIHPELIPDSIAYRLYFFTLSVGTNATEEDRNRRLMHLHKVGLRETDLNALVATLADFRTKHDVLVTQYNASADAALARNEAPDTAHFLRQLDALVQSTRDTLKLRLTPAGMTQLDAFVQSEKKMMRVQVPQ